jgi:hypothetical protein
MAKVTKMTIPIELVFSGIAGGVVANVVEKALIKQDFFKVNNLSDTDKKLIKNKLKIYGQKAIPVVIGIGCLMLSKKLKQPLLVPFGMGMVSIGGSNIASNVLNIGGVPDRMVLGSGRIADYIETQIPTRMNGVPNAFGI